MWVRCVVPVGLVGGCQIGDPPRAESVHLGVLYAVTSTKALSGAYRAVESKGTVNVSPFRACCVGKFVGGADGWGEDGECRLVHWGRQVLLGCCGRVVFYEWASGGGRGWLAQVNN